VQRRLHGADDPELRGVGAAEDDETRRAVAPHDLRVVRGDEPAKETRPAGERLAADLRHQVLEQERDAAQRPVGERTLRLGERPLEPPVDDGVDRTVARCDALDRRRHQLARVHLAATDELRLADRVELVDLGEQHGGCGRILRALPARPRLYSPEL
jgi:hypothetical protein